MTSHRPSSFSLPFSHRNRRASNSYPIGYNSSYGLVIYTPPPRLRFFRVYFVSTIVIGIVDTRGGPFVSDGLVKMSTMQLFIADVFRYIYL